MLMLFITSRVVSGNRHLFIIAIFNAQINHSPASEAGEFNAGRYLSIKLKSLWLYLCPWIFSGVKI